MGGSPPKAPSGPSPQEVAQMQIEAQRKERERLEAERNTNADNFLSDNPITDSFRADIGNRSQSVLENQLGVLDKQYGGTLDDIRQRQAGRGLGLSSQRFGLDRQAGTLFGQSRQDILDAGRKRVDDRLTQQRQILDRASNAIRGGTPISIAENQYANDLQNAEKAFDFNLRSAGSMDQRNRAYLDFEGKRQQSAARFKETVNRMEDDELLAARALNRPSDDEDNNAGQFGASTTNII